MPLWLDLLRNPMAAPETRRLKRLRRTWQSLCLALAGSILGFGMLQALLGAAAPILVFMLLVLTLAYSGLYWGQKHQADSAYLKEALQAATQEPAQ